MNQGKKPPHQRPAQKPRPAVPQQQPRTLEEKLRTEVEEFLRQVQGEKPKQPPSPQRPVVASPRPLVARADQPVETVIELEPERVSVQEHVARHIGTAELTHHAATLGAEVGQADERMVAHLQERFQHQLGALEPRQHQPTQVQRRRNIAAEIAEILRSPQGMRQMIVASEILRRPEI
jgi:hypothetical protein